MRFRRYIFKVIKSGYFWQRTDVKGKTSRYILFFSKTQLLIIAVSIFVHFRLKTSLNEGFVGYAISALSIFVGLFLTLILSIFDKFQNTFSNINGRETETENINLIRYKNFSIQFTSLMSYAILISVLCILLLSIRLVTDYFNDSIYNHPFVNYKNWNRGNVEKFLELLSISLYNVSLLYFLLDLILIILYGLGALHAYLMTEYSKYTVKKRNTPNSQL
ncbi:MAG: hypothetical protein O9353_10095 [Bacteroidia bacterium]|nr:hypothetical protein [Bacteroidia bacterium]